jgi:hypothetical protein
MMANERNDTELKSLIRDIENSAIDKGDWLSRRDINQIKASHAKHQRPALIIDILISTGFVEPQYKDYGLDFLELKKAVYGRLDAKTIAGSYFFGCSNIKKSNAQTIYEFVSKAIGSYAESFIDRALNAIADDSIRYEFVANTYRCAFEVLEKEIDLALKRIEEEEKKALANA